MSQIPGNGTITPPTPYTSRFRRNSAAALNGLYATPRSASGIQRNDDQGIEDHCRQDGALPGSADT